MFHSKSFEYLKRQNILKRAREERGKKKKKKEEGYAKYCTPFRPIIVACSWDHHVHIHTRAMGRFMYVIFSAVLSVTKGGRGEKKGVQKIPKITH